jgi:hypothetical protein
MRTVILLFLIFQTVQFSACVFAFIRIGRAKADNVYNRYVRLALLGLAFNDLMTFLSLLDVQGTYFNTAYIIKRSIGQLVESIALLLLCSYLLGLVNGIGWFDKLYRKPPKDSTPPQ